MGVKARGRPEEFDPMLLHTAFEKMIVDLLEKNGNLQKEIDLVEMKAHDEEKKQWSRVGDLQKKNHVCSCIQHCSCCSIIYACYLFIFLLT